MFIKIRDGEWLYIVCKYTYILDCASISHSGLKGLMCILVFSIYSEGHMHMYADHFVLCASFLIFHRYNAPQKNKYFFDMYL